MIACMDCMGGVTVRKRQYWNVAYASSEGVSVHYARHCTQQFLPVHNMFSCIVSRVHTHHLFVIRCGFMCAHRDDWRCARPGSSQERNASLRARDASLYDVPSPHNSFILLKLFFIFSGIFCNHTTTTTFNQPARVFLIVHGLNGINLEMLYEASCT